MDMGTPRAPLKDHKKEKKRKEETSIRAFLEEREYIVAKSIFPLLSPFFLLVMGGGDMQPFPSRWCTNKVFWSVANGTYFI